MGLSFESVLETIIFKTPSKWLLKHLSWRSHTCNETSAMIRLQYSQFWFILKLVILSVLPSICVFVRVLVGIRVLDGPLTDSMEAVAFNKHYQVNDVYSCRYFLCKFNEEFVIWYRYFNTRLSRRFVIYLLLLLIFVAQYCNSYCGIHKDYFQLITVLVGRLKLIRVVKQGSFY